MTRTRFDIFIVADAAYARCTPGTPIGALVCVGGSWVEPTTTVVDLQKRVAEVQVYWPRLSLVYQLTDVKFP